MTVKKEEIQLQLHNGVQITFLSYVLGSIIFGLGSTIFALIAEPGNSLNVQSIQGLFLIIIVGFLYSVTYMSPGFLLGAATGVVYLKLIKRRETVK